MAWEVEERMETCLPHTEISSHTCWRLLYRLVKNPRATAENELYAQTN